MKELKVVYKNADYPIQYECETYGSRHKSIIHGRPALVNLAYYAVYFEDERMKEQFGNPFEFFTGTYPNVFVRPFNDAASAMEMADSILKAIPREDSI